MALFRKSQQVEQLAVERIEPSPHQPRKIFFAKELEELSCSVAVHGIIQPLLVRRQGDHYELIAGERRLRAAKACGLTTVPCLVLSYSDEESAVLSLLENVQRQDLNFLEEALALKKLMEQEGMTQSRLAALVGCSQPAVANTLRILRLPMEELERLAACGATQRHARALLAVEDRTAREEILKKIEKDYLTVSQTERLAEKAAEKRPKIRRKVVLRDVRIFLNTLDKATALMKDSGIPVSVDQREEEGDLIVTVRVPKARAPKSFILTPEEKETVGKAG